MSCNAIIFNKVETGDNPSDNHIERCSFYNVNYGVSMANGDSFTIKNCVWDTNSNVGVDPYFIDFSLFSGVSGSRGNPCSGTVTLLNFALLWG